MNTAPSVKSRGAVTTEPPLYGSNSWRPLPRSRGDGSQAPGQRVATSRLAFGMVLFVSGLGSLAARDTKRRRAATSRDRWHSRANHGTVRRRAIMPTR